VRTLVIALAALYGLGYLYAGWLVLSFLRVMWEERQARPYAVFFAVLAPIGIAFYPIWLTVLWRPGQSRAWLDSHPELAERFDAGVEQLSRKMRDPPTLRDRWRFKLGRWRLWREIRR